MTVYNHETLLVYRILICGIIVCCIVEFLLLLWLFIKYSDIFKYQKLSNKRSERISYYVSKCLVLIFDIIFFVLIVILLYCRLY